MNQTQSASGPDKKPPPRVEILLEAAELIDGDRNVSYGTPTQNFTNIAEMWTTRFRHMLKDDVEFTAADVADAMILLKVARNIAQKKRDNYADLAGYAGCGYEAMLGEQPLTGVVTPTKEEVKKFARGGPISPGETGSITINVTSPDGVDLDAYAESYEAMRRARDRATDL